MPPRDGMPAGHGGAGEGPPAEEDVAGGVEAAGPAAGEEHRRGEPFDLVLARRWAGPDSGITAGVTAAREGADFGLTTAGSAWTVLERLEGLRDQLGFRSVVVPRQVHGRRVVPLEGGIPAGVVFVGEADGVVTAQPEVLLVVTAADCVPVCLYDPAGGAVGLLHAGWRGVAAGVLEEGLRQMTEAGAGTEDLRIYLGPAICGECYPVGPEVLRALGREDPAEDGGRLDLRGVLTSRIRASGVPPGRVVMSRLCTRCGPDLFHSHRGSANQAGRMAAFLGRRSGPGRRS